MADRKPLHVVLTDYGAFGWGITSPDLPELIGGRQTYEELHGDLEHILAFAAADPHQPRLLHLQRHYVLANGEELMIRETQDQHINERRSVGGQLVSALNFAGQITSMLAVPHRPTGEVLFICAVPSDTIGWTLQQLDTFDAACVAVSVSPNKIWTYHFATYPPGHTTHNPHAGYTLAASGWTENTTFTEMITRDLATTTTPPQRLIAV